MKKLTLGKILIYISVIVFALLCLLPLLLVLIVSFTPEALIISDGYSFFPKGLSLDAYDLLFANGTQVLRSYIITIFVTITGTIAATIITAMASFTLSNKSVYYRNSLAMYFFITMVFSGGMVPWYIICQKIGLYENILALIIPSLIFNPFNLFLVRNHMNAMPDSLMEAPKIDGATDITIAFKIYFPLSIPILATVALFYSIAYWNDWWNAIMLISDTQLYPMQYFLMKLKSDAHMMKNMQNVGMMNGNAYIPNQSLQMATAIVTIGPIILVYPFLQKYFVKGLVIGSVKG